MLFLCNEGIQFLLAFLLSLVSLQDFGHELCAQDLIQRSGLFISRLYAHHLSLVFISSNVLRIWSQTPKGLFTGMTFMTGIPANE